MNTIDGLGYFAASLVLATFCAKTMVALRSLAIASNFAFIAYGSTARLWPIVLLHAVMLPLNLQRLREILGPSAEPVPVKSRSSNLARALDRAGLRLGE
jgi:CRP/FNR family transcriptional regulator, cyclic AMP receptor protein